jgi:DNA-binding beta-propeller fold protein YncE
MKTTRLHMTRRTFVMAGAACALPLAACGGGGDGGPLMPVSVVLQPTAASSTGTRFATSTRAHQVIVTDPQGNTRTVGGLGRDAGCFNAPMDLAVRGDGAFIVETGNHRVQVVDAQGDALGFIGLGELTYPGGIAFHGDEMLVADSRNQRIVGFDLQGHVTRVLGTGVLAAPRGLAVTGDMLLVADPGRHQVFRFDLVSGIVQALGTGWVLPYDVATDGTSIYVVDAAWARVTVLDADGNGRGTIPLERAATFIDCQAGALTVA